MLQIGCKIKEVKDHRKLFIMGKTHCVKILKTGYELGVGDQVLVE